MNSARYWLLGLLALIAFVAIAEGALKHKNIPFLRPDRRRPCRPEWSRHQNQCYRIRHAPRLPSRDADRACQLESSQAQLVSLTDESRDFLANQVPQNGNNSFWVAGSDGACASFGKSGAQKSSSGCSDEKGYICAELTSFAGCPEGQIGFGDYCFSEATVRRTWRLARLFCRTVGLKGDLATIHSEEEYDFLMREFGNGGTDELWIGLHKDTPDTPYRWANGEKVKYLPWASSYMGQESSGYVTMSLRDRQFQAQNNSDLVIPFLCATVRVVDAGFNVRDRLRDATDAIMEEVDEARLAVQDANKAIIGAAVEVFINGPVDIAKEIIDTAGDVKDEVVDAAGDVQELLTRCDRFWVPFGNYCYKAFFEKTSFVGASVSCREKGGNLPSFHNPFQSEFVRTQVIRKRRSSSFWIGLASGRKGFQWSDGSPLDYMNWDSDESSALKLKSPFLQSCFRLDGWRVMWTPQTCEALLFYVCEKRKEEESSIMTSVTAPTTAGPPIATTPAPVKPTPAPDEPTDAPVEPTDAPVEPTDAPVPPTYPPVPTAGLLGEWGDDSPILLGFGEDLELSDEDKVSNDVDLASKQKSSSTKSGGSSHNTAAIFGVLGGAVAVVVVAFAVVTLRRRSKYQPYTKQPTRVRKISKPEAVSLDEVTRVIDPQQVLYGTME